MNTLSFARIDNVSVQDIITTALKPLRNRIEELEKENKKISGQISDITTCISCFPSTDLILIQDKFVLIDYFEKMEQIIQNILWRHEKDVLTYDILDTEKSKKNKLLSLKEKQRQMKVGEIWQEIIGNYDGFINLKSGHETGLDILSNTRKIARELKNRTNTDNAGSKKSNLDKLSKFKQTHHEYTCIYATINAHTEKKTLDGSKKKIIHDGVEIEHQVWIQFLTFIFGDETHKIIEFVKNTIDKYT